MVGPFKIVAANQTTRVEGCMITDLLVREYNPRCPIGPAGAAHSGNGPFPVVSGRKNRNRPIKAR